jgi:hypothetical protein
MQKINQMKLVFAILLTGITCISGAYAQDLFMTRTGQIVFHAGTPVEDVDGVNNEVTSMLNTKTGEIVFSVLIKSFHFKRSLMEEHFNENYMESNTFPKATYNGKLRDIQKLNLKSDGSQNFETEGDLTIHGVTQRVKASGTLTVSKGRLSGKASFVIKPQDYKIEIPGLVADKIAKDIQIIVDCVYEPRN